MIAILGICAHHMETLLELHERIAELRVENARLRERIYELESAKGIIAERYINELIGGVLTTGHAAHDITTPEGKRIEVKFARLNIPMDTSASRRWSWGHPLGSAGAKQFDSLVLVGEVDPRFRELYREPSSPYVIFDVPFESVPTLMGKSTVIQVTTNPRRKFGKAARIANTLFQQFHITSEDLRAKYKRA